MFNLFNNNKDGAASARAAALQETQQRWFSFLEKLEAKMEELCTAAIPELKELLATDDDNFQRTFYKVQSGINGQMQHIRRKAYDTYDEKILSLRNTGNLYDAPGLDFINACSDRYHKDFENRYQYWQQQLDNAASKDYEAEYRKILQDFGQTKDKFTCSQCGSPVAIPKIFFISTYIACPACNTQNTFEPGTSARNLQNIARNLAEQRTKHLLAAYEKEKDLERELYHINHELQLSLHFEKNKSTAAEKEHQVRQNESRRQQAISTAPQLYKTYLRAMYDEWNLIIPDLKPHNEKMYLRQLESNNLH